MKVLFVCLGNICRSPTAQGVFQSLVKAGNLQEFVVCDSAGTHDFHVGEAPDQRAVNAAAKRGYDLTETRARKIQLSDFSEYDYILAMVEFGEDGSHRVRYLRRPFRREPDFDAASVNYNFADLLVRAESPS